MSTGFLVALVNSTTTPITNISATAGSEGDWESTNTSPSIIHGSIPPGAASPVFHLERATGINTCPFSVTVTFSDGEMLVFTVDGKNAIDCSGNGKVTLNHASGKRGAFQLIVPNFQIRSAYNAMTLFITNKVWSN